MPHASMVFNIWSTSSGFGPEKIASLVLRCKSFLFYRSLHLLVGSKQIFFCWLLEFCSRSIRPEILEFFVVFFQ